MSYGMQKTRDLARDSLASTRRKGARDDRRHINQRHRHAVKQALREHKGDFIGDDPEEWFENVAFQKISVADRDYDRNIKEMMWGRRTDKLSAAYRWGEKLCEDVADEDVRTTVFKAMPDTVAGRHCANHVADYLEFNREYDNNARFGFYRSSYKATLGERSFIRLCRFVKYWEAMLEVIRDGRQKEFNARMGYPVGYFPLEGSTSSSRLTCEDNLEDWFIVNKQNLDPFGGHFSYRAGWVPFKGAKVGVILREMGYSVPA